MPVVFFCVLYPLGQVQTKQKSEKIRPAPPDPPRFGYQLFLSAEAVADFWLKGSVGSVGITIFGIHVGLTWSELRERFFAELDAQGMYIM